MGLKSNCDDCEGRDCILACNKNNIDGRSCPSLLNPPVLNSNKDCLVCGQCIKSCEPDNMQLLLRAPFSKSDSRESKTGFWLTIFIVLLSGFVTYELTTEWNYAKKLFLFVPTYLSNLIGIDSLNGSIKGIWTIGIFPFALWSLFGLFIYLFRGAKSIFEAWQKIALQMVIIIAAGHMIKAIAKLNSWLGYYQNSFEDPIGINTAMLYSSGSLNPTFFISKFIVSIIGLILLSASFIYSLREERLIGVSSVSLSLFPKIILFVLFSIIVLGIGLH